MAVANLYLGRTSRYYVAAGGNGLSTYGTAASFAGSSAMRIAKAMFAFDPHKYAPSPQRYQHPSQMALLLRRYDAKFQVDALWYPSGTLNTVGESDTWLANALGGTTANTTLATTFTGGGETTTTGTVVSAAGLAVGQFIRITTGGKVYARMLTTVAGAVLTWDPALPGAPANGDAVTGCITYKLGTAIPNDLDMASYPAAPAASTPARELLGCLPNKLVIACDSNNEPTIQLSGAAQQFNGSSPNWTPQSQPGSWTTVGAEGSIPSGLNMSVYYGGTLYQVTKVEFTILNTLLQQNNASGTSFATAMYRSKRREVTFKIDSMVSDDKTLWTPSLTAAQSNTSVLVQIGGSNGYIWAIYCPASLVLVPPSIPDTDETQQWSWMFRALGNLAAANDEISIGLM